MFAHGQQIRQNLRGVEFVRQPVIHRHARIARQFFHRFLAESAIFHRIEHSAQHARRVFNAFFVPDLAAGWLQVGYARALVARRHFKRAARAGAGFFKNQRNIFARQAAHFPALFFGSFEFGGQIQQPGNFGGREVGQVQKRTALQIHDGSFQCRSEKLHLRYCNKTNASQAHHSRFVHPEQAEKAACTWFRQTNGIKYRFHTSINRQKDSLCA